MLSTCWDAAPSVLAGSLRPRPGYWSRACSGSRTPPLLLYVCGHLGAVWLIRSLYFYSSVLSALADMGLNGLGLAAAIWAVTRTGSVFLGIWCFFLVQALFVFIPKSINHKPGTTRVGHESEDRFQHAYRVAEAAVRKLSSNH